MAQTHELLASTLFQVKDQVAVVTGGGSGIGLMAAQALAANGDSYCSSNSARSCKLKDTFRRSRVHCIEEYAITCSPQLSRTGKTEDQTDADKLEAAAKAHKPGDEGAIIPCGPCDVTKKDDLNRLVEEISSKEKQVNIMVLAAGQAGPKAEPEPDNAVDLKKKLWDNETSEAWGEVYNADVTSLYFSTVAFLPLLEAGAKGSGHWTSSVITISSISGLIRHAQGHFAYNAAKGATIQLTKLMSAEFMKLNIRVNSIAPGYFPSELTAKESGDDQKSELHPKYVQEKGHVPMQRPGVDEEIAQAVLFFAKNHYTTGQIVSVDGGVLNVLGS